MAGLFYLYSVTSIQAAKRNAKMHREADGGQISWQNENMRRHGVLKAPGGDKGTIASLMSEARQQLKGDDDTKDKSDKKD